MVYLLELWNALSMFFFFALGYAILAIPVLIIHFSIEGIKDLIHYLKWRKEYLNSLKTEEN